MDAARLRRRSAISRVRASGRARDGRLFSLRWLPNDERMLRLAVTAAGGFRGAVPRNRARRRVHEAFRAELTPLTGVGGIDVVVSARSSATSAPWTALRAAAAAAIAELRQ